MTKSPGLTLMILFWSSLNSTESEAGAKEPTPVYRFGDRVKIISGEYAGGTAIILDQTHERTYCVVARYRSRIFRKGLHREGYVCGEDVELVQDSK